MTEKQREELAEQVANKVIEAMEKKQREWDKEFQEALVWQVNPAPKKSSKETLALLKELLSQALYVEDYIAADKISKEINKILNKLK